MRPSGSHRKNGAEDHKDQTIFHFEALSHLIEDQLEYIYYID
jgi:hypothetical protein